jgi:hypothetical protein
MLELEVKLPTGETDMPLYQLGQDIEAVMIACVSRCSLDEALTQSSSSKRFFSSRIVCRWAES